MADSLDEMREMAEAVDAIDDATFDPDVLPPVPVEEPVETDPAPEADKADEPKETPQEEAQELTLDDLLAGEAPEAKPVEKAKEEPAGEEQPEAKEPESGAKARVREATAETAEWKKRYDELVALQMKQAQQPEPAQEQEQAQELDPDVEGYMDPYIDKGVDRRTEALVSRLDAIEQSVQPIQDKLQDQLMAAEIAKFVPGFKPEMMGTLKTEFDAMPEAEQPVYRDGGIAGAVILAQKMAGRGALAVGNTNDNKPSELASRHNSDMGSDTSVIESNELSDEEKAALLENADEETILRMLQQLEAQG